MVFGAAIRKLRGNGAKHVTDRHCCLVIPSAVEESLDIVWPLLSSEIFRDVSTLLDMTTGSGD